MALFKFSCLFCVLLLLFLHTVVRAQPSMVPAPSPASDGIAIDLGVAYALMFVALLVTYLVHPVDAFPFNLF
ncbi:hypothetical protein L7F22_014478 [Adiantum nelumboides]|nr:hypothetical protein [Adiantum nelumboides]